MCTPEAELDARMHRHPDMRSRDHSVILLCLPALYEQATPHTAGLGRSIIHKLRSMSPDGSVGVLKIVPEYMMHVAMFIAGGPAAEPPGSDQARRPPDQERGHRGAVGGRAAAGLPGARHAGALRRGRRHLHAQAAQGVARPVPEQASPRTASVTIPLPSVMRSSPSPQTVVHARCMQVNADVGQKVHGRCLSIWAVPAGLYRARCCCCRGRSQ